MSTTCDKVAMCMGFLLLSAPAAAQDAPYACMEQALTSEGQCASFTDTLDGHVAAGRVTLSFFGTYRAVGTGERLGRNNGGATLTLIEVEAGSFSADVNSCPSTSRRNLVLNVELRAAGPVNNGQNGNVRIVNNPSGPDLGIADINGLAPNSTFTLVMAQSDAPNALPHYLLAEFSTNSEGDAVVVLATELVNAYIGANPSRDADLDGVAEGPAPGAVANGAITVSMDFFRVYAADGNANVFGVSPDDLSGGIVLTSERIADPS